MKLHTRRAEIVTVVLAAVAIVGVSAWLFKPKFLHGESRRAEASQSATAAVVETVAAADAAQSAKSAAAAASVAQIGVAASGLPPTPAGDFIRREVPVALGYLPAPDPAALLEAERRRLAVMEGRLQEAQALYSRAMTDAAAAQARAEKAEADRAAALESRRQADAAISEAAAANLALEKSARLRTAGLVLAAAVAVFLWFSRISPAKIGEALAAIRTGSETPTAAFDRLLPAWMHRKVNRAARLADTAPTPSG